MGRKHLAVLLAGSVLGTRTALNGVEMSRPTIKNDADKLTNYLRIRVDDSTINRLKKMQARSNTKGISQLARKILMEEPVHLLHRDVSMDGPMEELALIRKEIRAIGININQQTHHFHISKSHFIFSFTIAGRKYIITPLGSLVPGFKMDWPTTLYNFIINVKSGFLTI